MEYKDKDEDDAFWNRKPKSIPERPLVVDKRQVKLSDILGKTYIPFLGGRPNRDEIINADDIANLKIAQNLSSNVDEFLQQV